MTVFKSGEIVIPDRRQHAGDENKNQIKKMKIETTEPTIITDTLEELRAMHEARLDYMDACDCCWEDSAE